MVIPSLSVVALINHLYCQLSGHMAPLAVTIATQCDIWKAIDA